MAASLSETAQTLLTCVSDALSDALRPVCKAYQTVGTPVIATCCECDDVGTNGEISIHFRRLFDANPTTLEEVQRVRPCRGGITAAQFRLVLARCLPVVDEHGELPAPEVFNEKAEEQLEDAELMWGALSCCSGRDIRIDDVSVDLGPLGGCSIVFVDLTVPVLVPAMPSGGSA